MPLVALLSHELETRPGLDQLGHVGLEREVDDVGRQAVDHRGGLRARGAERGRDGDAAARLGLGEVLGQHGVGRLGRRVGDQVDRAALGAGRQGGEGKGSEGQGADAGDAAEATGGGHGPLRRVGSRDRCGNSCCESNTREFVKQSGFLIHRYESFTQARAQEQGKWQVQTGAIGSGRGRRTTHEQSPRIARDGRYFAPRGPALRIAGSGGRRPWREDGRPAVGRRAKLR